MSATIHWIVSYPMDSVIHLSNNPSLRSSRFLSFSRRRDRASGWAKERAWGDLSSPPPPYFSHSLAVSFPSCAFLETPGNAWLRRLEQPGPQTSHRNYDMPPARPTRPRVKGRVRTGQNRVEEGTEAMFSTIQMVQQVKLCSNIHDKVTLHKLNRILTKI